MRTVLLVPFLFIAASAQGQDSPADRIAPLLTDTTVAVGRLDISKLNVEAALSEIKPFVPLADVQWQQFGQAVRGGVAALRGNGVKQIFAVLDAKEVGPDSGFYLVVPISQDVNRDALRGLASSLPFETVEELKGTLVCGPKSVLERLKKNEQAASARPHLKDAFSAATGPIQIVVVPTADQQRILRETLPDLSAEWGGASGERLAASLRWASLSVGFEPQISAALVVQSESEQAAEVLKSTMTATLRRLSSDEQLITAVPIFPMIAEALVPHRENDRLVIKADEALEAVSKTLAALSKLAQKSAYELQSANNLKQIGLAFHNFHDTYGSFPPAASYDANGKPLLSWRVYLLPYLGELPLYQQFHLDEPWDSEHNRKLIDKMPQVFRSPLADLPSGQTTYLAPVGAGFVFDGKAGTPILQIADGTFNTILIVEATADRAVPWTKPEDLKIDPQNPLAGLTEDRDTIPMLFGDGSVHRESSTGDPQTYYELMTKAGGEVIDRDKLKER